jgi:nitrite reductase/ring-hydroxylating ferredoxin subunit
VNEEALAHWGADASKERKKLHGITCNIKTVAFKVTSGSSTGTLKLTHIQNVYPKWYPFTPRGGRDG